MIYLNQTYELLAGGFHAGNRCNHSIFRYDNFIGCFSADKIKMSVRK